MRRLILLALVFVSIGATAQDGKKYLPVGEKAPIINAVDQNGEKVNSDKILQNKKLIVIFYRGVWCPYCNKHLAAIQDGVEDFKKAGARLIAITPENPENIDKTIEKTKASYSILWDKDNKIMKSFGVDFVLSPKLQEKYKKFGIDLPEANGNDSQVLPVTATYIINQDGTIKYVHYNPDHKNRASAKEILENL